MKHTREHPSRSLGFLSRHHDGELSRDEIREFERHVADCRECADATSEYEAILAMYRDTVSEEPDSSLAGRISRRIDREIRDRASVRFLAPKIDLLWASIVAVGLVGVLALYGLIGRRKAIPAVTVAENPPPSRLETSPAAPKVFPPRALSPPRRKPVAPAPSGETRGGTPEFSSETPPPEPVAEPAEALSSEKAGSRAKDAGVRSPLRVGGAVVAPILLHRVEPVVPEPIRRHVVSVSPVVVEAVITELGDVTLVRIIHSNPSFDEAVLGAVRQWKYKPALLDGQPVSVYLTVTVNIASPPG